MKGFRIRLSRKRSASGPVQEQPAALAKPGWIELPVRPRSPLAARLEANIATIEAALGSSPDLVIRRFRIGGDRPLAAALVYVEGLANASTVNESILGSLLSDLPCADATAGLAPRKIAARLGERGIAVGKLQEAVSLEEALYAILAGESLLLLEGSKTALRLGTTGFEGRPVETPETEVVVRGPREGFTETLPVNISLLRRRLRTPDLRFERMDLGERTGTRICVAYLQGVADDKLVAEVRRRLRRIRIDGVLESGYIENLIEDAAFSPFPTVSNTERPDVLAAKLLEGRVGILVDGTPWVLTVPCLFIENFQVAEDYYMRPLLVTLIRWIRYLALAISLTAPPFVVAVQTFHAEVLPRALMMTMTANKEGIPFPAVLEALGMILVFEVLKEAGVRLPRPVGQAVSIVGALVLGESAVRAGLVSNTMVVTIASMGIAGFLVPPIAEPVTLLRYPLLVLGASLGLPGLAFGLIAILTHLVGLRSFGVPYLSPLAPAHYGAWKDVLYRAPWWAMTQRPPLIGEEDPRRLTPAPQRPEPPAGGRRRR